MKTHLNRWFWLGCLFVLLAGVTPARAFYNPTSGRWLSRDPIGETKSKNLIGFVENNPVVKFDYLGLLALPPSPVCIPPFDCSPRYPKPVDNSCKTCKCKRVTVSPQRGIGVVVHFPTVDIGVLVPVSIEVEGDRSKCKCRATDSGTFTYGLHRTVNTYDPNVSHEVPGCADYTDMPGVNQLQPFPPGVSWSGQKDGPFDYVYAMTISVTCENSDGSGSVTGSASINNRYVFWLEYENNNKVNALPPP